MFSNFTGNISGHELVSQRAHGASQILSCKHLANTRQAHVNGTLRSQTEGRPTKEHAQYGTLRLKCKVKLRTLLPESDDRSVPNFELANQLREAKTTIKHGDSTTTVS